MRHKYALDLIESGADIRVVQDLLGHADLGTTQVYLAVTDKRLREAVNLLDSSCKEPARKTIGDPNKPKWMQELDKIANNGKNYIINRDGSLEEVP